MRFEREAKTLAALNHPNIGAIYGIEDRALVMELVAGDDLSTIIARGPLPLADAARPKVPRMLSTTDSDGPRH